MLCNFDGAKDRRTDLRVARRHRRDETKNAAHRIRLSDGERYARLEKMILFFNELKEKWQRTLSVNVSSILSQHRSNVVLTSFFY